MSEEKNALPPEGPAKPAQNPEKIASLSSRERLLLPLTFGFCLLLVNTLLETGPTAGLTAAVCAWYALLTVCQGRKLLIAGESRFLLATNLVLAATLALGSNWYFRVWNLLALLALLPIHAVGLSGGQRLPWWRPAMLWERLCLLLWGLFGHLWAVVAAPPGASCLWCWARRGPWPCWRFWCRCWPPPTRCSPPQQQTCGPSCPSTFRTPCGRPLRPR